MQGLHPLGEVEVFTRCFDLEFHFLEIAAEGGDTWLDRNDFNLLRRAKPVKRRDQLQSLLLWRNGGLLTE